MAAPISRFDVPDRDSLPEDLRTRIQRTTTLTLHEVAAGVPP